MDTAAPRPDQMAVPSDTPAARRRFTITITTRTMWMGALILLAIVAVVVLITKASGPVTLLILAIILGEAIRPLVARLKRYRIPGPLAVLLIYLVVLLVVGVLLWLLASPLLNELSAFIRDLPQYLVQLQNDVHRLEQSVRVNESVNSALDALSTSLVTFLRSSVPTLLAVPFNALTGLFSLFIDLVIVLTMALFWLMSSAKLKPFIVGLFPAQLQQHASLVIGEIGRSFGGYVRGLLIGMVIIGLMAGLGLTVLGVPFALLLGVVAGLTELIPYVGPWISGTIATLMALVAVDPAKAIQVIILFFLVFTVEGELVQPLVMSQAVRVDPLVVLVSVLIGLSLLGVIGAILAVPVAAGIQVLIVQILAPALRRASGQSSQTAQSPPAVTDHASVSVPEAR